MDNNKLGKDFMLVVAGQIVSLFGNAILRFPCFFFTKKNRILIELGGNSSNG